MQDLEKEQRRVSTERENLNKSFIENKAKEYNDSINGPQRSGDEYIFQEVLQKKRILQ